MSSRHRSSASTLLLLLSPAMFGACSTPPPAAPVVAVRRAPIGAPASALVVAAPDVLRLRLVEQPDPGTTGVVIPDVVELPSGDIAVAGTSWAANLGPGAEHIADGFVAGFAPDGARRWLCLSASPPADLGVDGAGGVYVALSEPGVVACAPGAGVARPEGRWGAAAGPLFSSIEVAIDAAGRPRWSTPYPAASLPLLHTAVGAHGSVVQIGGIDTSVLSTLDENGGARWSRRGKHVGRGRHLEVAVSSDGGVALFNDGFTGTLDGAKTTPSPLPARSLVMLDRRGNIAWSDAMLATVGPRHDESLVVHAVAFDGSDLLVLGHAMQPLTLGGKAVPCNPGGSLFLGRLDASGAAKWVRTFEQARGLDPREPTSLLRGWDGGVIMVSRSFGPPPTEQPSERNVDVLLTHLDREGHDVSRRPLAFAGMSPPRFAASASGDAVLISAVVDTAAQQKSLFPDAPFVPASAGRNILIGRLMVE